MKESLSLTQLAAELDRQQETKIDYLVPANRIQFVSSGPSSEIDLLSPTGEALAEALVLNDHAHGQFSDRLKIPKRYYDRMRTDLPGLLDQNVNTLLQYHPDGPAKNWMIRTLDGTARAALSDQYNRIDNFDIAEVVLPVLAEIPDVEIRSAAITDTFMHIKATTPRLRGEVKVGDVVTAGVYIRNSEVGGGKVAVYPFLERLWCSNGNIVMVRGDGMMERIHLGRRVEAGADGIVFSDETRAADDRAFILSIRDVVRAAVSEVRFRELIAEMARAARSEEIQDVGTAIAVLAKREGLTEHEGSGILSHLARGGDLTRWGMLNAVTRMAEDVPSYDRATELEALGGKILYYTDRDWRTIATADLLAA